MQSKLPEKNAKQSSRKKIQCKFPEKKYNVKKQYKLPEKMQSKLPEKNAKQTS